MNFSQFKTSFGWPGDKLPTTDGRCRQTHLSYAMFEHVQVIRTVCSHAHSRTTQTREAQGQQGISRLLWCAKRTCHPSVMSNPLHLSLSTSTRSLSSTSLVFQSFSPSRSHSLVLDPFSCPRRSGGSAKIPSPTRAARVLMGTGVMNCVWHLDRGKCIFTPRDPRIRAETACEQLCPC